MVNEYLGTYALIYVHTLLGEGIVSRDGLPRGVLPSGILKIEKYCLGLKVRFLNLPQRKLYDQIEIHTNSKRSNPNPIWI